MPIYSLSEVQLFFSATLTSFFLLSARVKQGAAVAYVFLDIIFRYLILDIKMYGNSF